MTRLSFYAGTNRIARLVVGAVVVFFIYRGVTDRHAEVAPAAPAMIQTANANLIVPKLTVDPTDRLVTLAQTDHIALLKWAMQNYENHIQDYTLVFYKQERINGKLKPVEKIAVTYKDAPHSVLMKWSENPGAIDKLLYVEGANENKMIVHPTGMLAWIKSVKRDPCGEEARKSSRGTCDQFGFRRNMQNLLKVYELAQSQGDLQIKYLGETEVLGRPCVAMERRLPPKEQYPYGRLVMEFDKEYILPIGISCYDWQDNLLSRYTFGDVKFNIGVTAGAFMPGTNSL
jgi:hypothetical protein